MSRSRPIFVPCALAIVFALRLATELRADLFRITNGTFATCCTFEGSGHFDLPAPAQWFVELREQAAGDTIEMRFLNVFLEEFRPRPEGFRTAGVELINGQVSGKTTRFFDDQMVPQDPLPGAIGQLDYTATLSGDSVEIAGGFWCRAPCADCYVFFSHADVHAIRVEGTRLGDLNGDTQVNVDDLELLKQTVRAHADDRPGLETPHVLKAVERWIKEVRRTWYGDANLDGEFNAGDFIQVFEAGKYETQQAAGWAEGDWDGDGVFDTGDFVKAFEDGGYEKGPRPDPAAVPEPSAWLLLVLGLYHCLWGRRTWSVI